MKNQVETGPRGGKIYVCENWPEAFSLAREAGHPITARVNNETGRCFPSGRFEPRGKVNLTGDVVPPKSILGRPTQLTFEGIYYEELLWWTLCCVGLYNADYALFYHSH